MYHGDKLINQDLSRAIVNYEKACEDGYVKACTNLGTIYLNKNDFTDMDKAVAHFLKGCEGDDSMACFKLAFILRKGDKAGERNEVSREYLRKACRLEPTSKFCGRS